MDGLDIQQRRLFAELLDVVVTLLSVLLALGKEFFGMLGVDDRELAEAGLLHDEVAEFGEIRFLAIEGQRALAFGLEARIVTEGGEVTAFDGFLLLLNRVDEAAFDVLLGAGAVADDQGRAVIGFGFLQGLDGFGGVGAKGDLGDIDVAISHRHEGQVLLRFLLTRGGELIDRAGLRGFGSLAAGVGINFGVED